MAANGSIYQGLNSVQLLGAAIKNQEGQDIQIQEHGIIMTLTKNHMSPSTTDINNFNQSTHLSFN